jgi:hypothetical protein
LRTSNGGNNGSKSYRETACASAATLSESPAAQQNSFSCFEVVEVIKDKRCNGIDRGARSVDHFGPLQNLFHELQDRLWVNTAYRSDINSAIVPWANLPC